MLDASDVYHLWLAVQPEEMAFCQPVTDDIDMGGIMIVSSGHEPKPLARCMTAITTYDPSVRSFRGAHAHAHETVPENRSKVSWEPIVPDAALRTDVACLRLLRFFIAADPAKPRSITPG